jgi:hypothetical protein
VDAQHGDNAPPVVVTVAVTVAVQVEVNVGVQVALTVAPTARLSEDAATVGLMSL